MCKAIGNVSSMSQMEKFRGNLHVWKTRHLKMTTTAIILPATPSSNCHRSSCVKLKVPSSDPTVKTRSRCSSSSLQLVIPKRPHLFFNCTVLHSTKIKRLSSVAGSRTCHILLPFKNKCPNTPKKKTSTHPACAGRWASTSD